MARRRDRFGKRFHRPLHYGNSMQVWQGYFVATLKSWISGCVFVLTAYCLWSLNRGLDLTDESYYLAAAIHPKAVRVWATAMHWLTAPLWDISGSLLAFRALGFALLTMSSVIMALGAARVFQQIHRQEEGRCQQTLLIVAGSVASAMLYHSFVPFTPSYNLLAVTGAYLSLGIACFSVKITGSGRLLLLQCLAGIALAIAFLAKFSTGTIAWTCVCCLTVVCGATFRHRLIGVSCITLAMLATLLVFVVCHGSIAETLAQFRLGVLVYMLGANETFPARLLRYSRETWAFMTMVGADFSIPLVFLTAYAFRPHRWLLLTGFAGLIFVVASQGYFLGGMERHEQQAAPLLMIVAFALFAIPRQYWRNARSRCLLATLALLPFGIAIGSFNPIHVQVLLSLAPWGILVALPASATQGNILSRPQGLVLTALFLTIIAVQTISNGLLAPYRQYLPLTAQNEAMELPELGTVLLDGKTRETYRQLQQLAVACHIQKHAAFVGLYNIPGIALILDAIPVGLPILQDRVSTEAVLGQLTQQQLSTAVVAIDRDTESYDSSMPKQLASFPDGYRSCGAVTLPFQDQNVELWIGTAG
jgi:hypothetical protein